MKKIKAFSFLIFILVCSCSENNQLRSDFISEIESKADTDQIITVLSDTDFNWHLMYQIPDWYSEGSISSIIGFDWKGRSVPDQYYRCLFVDTITKSTEYFDYYMQGNLPQIRICFDFDSMINGNQVSYIYKENCKFKSHKENGYYWEYSAYSRNCK